MSRTDLVNVFRDGRWTKMPRPRDSQRSSVYAAEKMCSWWHTTARRMDVPEFVTADAAERFVNRIRTTKRAQRYWPKFYNRGLVQVVMNDNPQAWTCRGGAVRITLTRYGRTRAILIHELAHTVTLREQVEPIAFHGWQFCAAYLKLVTMVFGKDAAAELRYNFKLCRVRYTAPRKLSPERRAQLREQGKALALMRAATTHPIMGPALRQVHRAMAAGVEGGPPELATLFRL